MNRSVFVAALLIMCAGMRAYAACDAPQLTLPSASRLTDTQPRLSWKNVAQATAYRVRLQSRVPDGLVIAAHDSVVAAPEFLAPRPLTEHRAKVTVRLRAVCGSEMSEESVFSFVIDTSPVCKLGEVEATLESGKASLKWQPVAGARSYEVRAYRLVDGAFLASQETRDAATQMPLREPAVVSVRPACSAGLGDAVYRVVAAR